MYAPPTDGQQPNPMMPGAPAAPGAPGAQLSPEQYQMLSLQYQLQQSQAQAQVQAQLLQMYQQQQQQHQLNSAAAAYHQALASAARTQASAPYGLPAGGAVPQQQQQPPVAPYAAQGTPAGPVPTMFGQQQAQPAAGVLPPPMAQPMAPPMGAMPPVPGAPAPLPAAAPTPMAALPSSAPNPHDSRIHADLLPTPVEWVPLPPRYVMDAVAKTAVATKAAQLRREAQAAGTIAPEDETTPMPSQPTKTVFVGGISYDVARDPRVIPWLAATMCGKPVIVRKVIPHKERRSKQRGAEGDVNPKLALSAFVQVEADGSDSIVECLHHRVLWDIGGCWVAKSPEAVAALRDYSNAQCTWQKREAGAIAGLPRHMMTVEPSTAAGSHERAHKQPQQQAQQQQDPNSNQTTPPGAQPRTQPQGHVAPAVNANVPADTMAAMAQQHALLPDAVMAPAGVPPSAIRIDWSFLPSAPTAAARPTSSHGSSSGLAVTPPAGTP